VGKPTTPTAALKWKITPGNQEGAEETQRGGGSNQLKRVTGWWLLGPFSMVYRGFAGELIGLTRLARGTFLVGSEKKSPSYKGNLSGGKDHGKTVGIVRSQKYEGNPGDLDWAGKYFRWWDR